jgi:pseudaminic acid biosynthesis-associated methylase
MKDRLDLWTGNFGNEYFERNTLTEENITARAQWLFKTLWPVHQPKPIKSVFEFGCGNGANLAALQRCLRGATRYGCEPNETAATEASRFGFISNHIGDAKADLALTCGVLIHIPPGGLPDVMQAIYDVATRYILCAEYFAPQEEAIPYRGEDAALWRRPYGDLWMNAFPLKHISHGFLWKRVDGLDNLTWWLLEKTG